MVYRTSEEWAKIREISKQYFSEKSAVNHYYGTAKNTYEEYLKRDTVRYKKYFYALRPILAAEYIEKYHVAPPVLFDDLLKLDLEPEVRKAINGLLEVKKHTTEKEENPQIPAIQDYILEELKEQKEIADNMPDDHNRDIGELNRIFREVIQD